MRALTETKCEEAFSPLVKGSPIFAVFSAWGIGFLRGALLVAELARRGSWLHGGDEVERAGAAIATATDVPSGGRGQRQQQSLC